MSCDIHTRTPARASYTNFQLYYVVIQICSTNCLRHGHGYECHSPTQASRGEDVVEVQPRADIRGLVVAAAMQHAGVVGLGRQNGDVPSKSPFLSLNIGRCFDASCKCKVHTNYCYWHDPCCEHMTGRGCSSLLGPPVSLSLPECTPQVIMVFCSSLRGN